MIEVIFIYYLFIF